MSKALQSTSKQLKSSQLSVEPDITKEGYKDLPRVDRIYYSIMYPRHFQLNFHESEYFRLIQSAHSILLSAATDFQARQLIKNMRAAKSFSLSDTLELIRDTQTLFGKIEMNDMEFKRIQMRHRLQSIAERARKAGDIKNERLALQQLINLDALATRDKEADGPVVPPLPNVRFGDFEDAIIISSPQDESGEEE